MNQVITKLSMFIENDRVNFKKLMMDIIETRLKIYTLLALINVLIITFIQEPKLSA